MFNFFLKYDPKKYWEKRGMTHREEQIIKGKDPVRKKHQEMVIDTWFECLKNLKFKTVLEYGCGHGTVAKSLLENFDIDEYVGMDISSGQINNAKELGLDKAKFHHSAILDFSTEQKFDLVFGTGVLMHVPTKLVIPSLQKLSSFSNRYVMNMDDGYQPVRTQRLARHCFNHNYEEIYKNQLGLDVKVTPLIENVILYYADKQNQKI